MRLRGAVFDLDGVLYDTEGLQLSGWLEALKGLGLSLTRKEYLQYAGKPGKKIEGELVKKHRIEAKPGSLLALKENALLEWLKSRPPRLLPCAREALEFFRDRKMPVAAASAAPRGETLLKLKGAGLLEFFGAVITLDDVKRGKPYPDMYLKAASSIGLKPQSCAAFEDTEFGLLSAKNARIGCCIAIPNEFSEGQDFSKADKVAKDLKEAIEWLKRRYIS